MKINGKSVELTEVIFSMNDIAVLIGELPNVLDDEILTKSAICSLVDNFCQKHELNVAETCMDLASTIVMCRAMCGEEEDV